MLALVPSRGWNYHTVNVNPALTVSLYADPNLVNNTRALIASVVSGTVPTVLTSSTSVYDNLAGALGIVTDGSNNATIVSEISAGSSAAVPGTPLFAPGSLTVGQTWSPYPGATATVVAVGAMPNANACPNPVPGAQIRFTYAGYDQTGSFVPGCGITDWKNNTNGAEFALASVGSYGTLGQLHSRVQAVTLLDTARSLLGLERNPSFKPIPGF